MRLRYSRDSSGPAGAVTVYLDACGQRRRLGWITRVTEPFGYYQFAPATEFLNGSHEWQPREVGARSHAILRDVKDELERSLFVAIVGSFTPPRYP